MASLSSGPGLTLLCMLTNWVWTCSPASSCFSPWTQQKPILGSFGFSFEFNSIISSSLDLHFGLFFLLSTSPWTQTTSNSPISLSISLSPWMAPPSQDSIVHVEYFLYGALLQLKNYRAQHKNSENDCGLQKRPTLTNRQHRGHCGALLLFGRMSPPRISTESWAYCQIEGPEIQPSSLSEKMMCNFPSSSPTSFPQ